MDIEHFSQKEAEEQRHRDGTDTVSVKVDVRGTRVC